VALGLGDHVRREAEQQPSDIGAGSHDTQRLRTTVARRRRGGEGEHPLHVEAGDGPGGQGDRRQQRARQEETRVVEQVTGRGTLSRWVMSGEWPASSASGDGENQASWMGSCPFAGRQDVGDPSRSARRSATIRAPRTSQRRLPQARMGRHRSLRAGVTLVSAGAAGERRNRGGHRPAGPPLRLGDGAALAPSPIGRTWRAPPWCSGARTPSTHRRAGPAPPPSTSRSMRCWSTSMTMRSISHEGDGAAVDRLGGDVPMQNPWVPPLNRPSVTSAQSPRADALHGAGHRQHLAHAGPPFGPS